MKTAANHIPLAVTDPNAIDERGVDFTALLARHGLGPLRRDAVRTLQVNVGKLCNQACHHCHVDAGPKRTEVMVRDVATRVTDVLAANAIVDAIDITGGAPELNPHFAFLVESARALGRRVIDRCNLTVFYVDGMAWLPDYLCAHEVEIVSSLPCYTEENVDQQRGSGVFQKSIDALRRLNALGYGQPDSPLRLDLVYNPIGASLPPAQATLESRYRDELRRHFGIEFHRLRTITNMPIKRFAEQLRRWGRHAEYMGLLANHFNPSTVPALMCRSLVSVGWDGRLYDCDFNQMLEMPIGGAGPRGGLTIWDVEDLGALAGAPVATAAHCLGCTAGAGSSCGGALG
jgi:radical SAM/Cys-rich protein